MEIIFNLTDTIKLSNEIKEPDYIIVPEAQMDYINGIITISLQGYDSNGNKSDLE